VIFVAKLPFGLLYGSSEMSVDAASQESTVRRDVEFVSRAPRIGWRMAESGPFERLVQLTESFFGELVQAHGTDSCDCMSRYLAALDELGCHDLRIVRQVAEAVASGGRLAVQAQDRHEISPSVRLALEFLHQHYTERITWRDVGASVRRNSAYLARRFRHETGTTLRQRLSELRLRRAAQLIGSGDKVEFVMLSVGYQSKRTFYAHFRTFFG
jgi:AraC-like DNA-binding protein